MTRRALDAALVAAAVVVALLTLVPDGTGWSWGAPLTELRWYATGWSSGPTLLQFTGNLALLAPLAVLAVLRRPDLGTPLRLAAASGTAAVGIELLQWLLPLGRVVSPVDALLNATGAVVAGLVVLRSRARPDRIGAADGAQTGSVRAATSFPSANPCTWTTAAAPTSATVSVRAPSTTSLLARGRPST